MRTKVAQPTIEGIEGTVERITFHNVETGFCVLKVHTNHKIITVVGFTLAVQVGESIEAKGRWINDHSHGLQFQADSITIIKPTTLAGIEKYLGSGLIKGIGPHFAKKLVYAFKEKVFAVIEETPEKLLTLGGIGKLRQEQLLASWKLQQGMRKLMLFLQSHQVSSTRAVRIYKTYGEKAVQKIQENPYRLAQDIHGVGFKTADMLAQKMGISSHSLLRAAAGVQQVMHNLSTEGHCAAPAHILESHTQTLLEMPANLVQTVIDKAIHDGQLIKTEVDGQAVLALAQLHRTEQGIALQLKRLMADPLPPWNSLDTNQVITHLQNNIQIQLSSTQQSVLIQMLAAKLFILTGGPGVGKTTIVRNFLTILNQLTSIKIGLCAPTGRAAQRLTETTKWPAKTIHRLLGVGSSRFTFKHNLDNPLEMDLLIVDEASMLDVSLTYQLLKAIPSKCAIVFIGDSDQLPSVGPGKVLADLLKVNRIPSAALTEVFRQASTSSIIVNAHRINQGKTPYTDVTDTLSDFYFIESQTAEDMQTKLIQLVKQRIPQRFQLDPIQDVQVLTPMNRGSLGTLHLNQALQNALNPENTVYVERFGIRFSVNDKVIQQVNNYNKEVFNGDIGHIQSINIEETELKVLFIDRVVAYDFNELDELNLAYAMSIHKSQGSEYPAVVIPITMQHYRMLARNLLYTAVTRGKRLVVLIGEKKALKVAVHTTQSNQRLTQLVERVTEVLV